MGIVWSDIFTCFRCHTDPSVRPYHAHPVRQTRRSAHSHINLLTRNLVPSQYDSPQFIPSYRPAVPPRNSDLVAWKQLEKQLYKHQTRAR